MLMQTVATLCAVTISEAQGGRKVQVLSSGEGLRRRTVRIVTSTLADSGNNSQLSLVDIFLKTAQLVSHNFLNEHILQQFFIITNLQC